MRLLAGSGVNREVHAPFCERPGVQLLRPTCHGLHWTLDMVFREDHCRVRKGHAARNFSVLRKFALATLRQEEEAKMGLRRRRVHADRHPEYRESLIRRAFSQNGSENPMPSV